MAIYSVVYVVVKFSFEGVHYWPDAAGQEAYLQHPHRHLFYVEATKRVSHLDRDIEIIGLSRTMKGECERMFAGPHHMSCEEMAFKLAEWFGLSRCQVLEDNENGAEVISL